LPHVADDTDDRHALEGIEGTKDGPAERVLVRKCLSSNRLIDHRDERPVKRIAVIEVAPGPQRDSERRERTRRHDRKDRRRPTPCLRLRGHLVDEVGPGRLDRSRRRHRRSGRQHARQAANPGEHVFEELARASDAHGRRRGHARPHYQHVLGPKSQGHVVQRHEALDQQAGAGDQDHRQRDLRDHHRAAQTHGPAAHDARRSLLQSLTQFDLRRIERRNQAE
jgi:hypothetical protein